MDVTLPLTTRDGAGGLEGVAAVAHLHGSRLVLRRRLAGLVLVELRLEIDSLELPDPVRRAHAESRRVRAHVDCEASARSGSRATRSFSIAAPTPECSSNGCRRRVVS